MYIYIWPWDIKSTLFAFVFSGGYANKQIGWSRPRLTLLSPVLPGSGRPGLAWFGSVHSLLGSGLARQGSACLAFARLGLGWLGSGSALSRLVSIGLGAARLKTTLLPVMGK